MTGTRSELHFIRSRGTKIIYSFIPLFLLVLSFPFTVHGAIPAFERAALIAFYISANGDGWNDNSGWKTGPLDTDGFAMPGSENAWYGITINGDSVEEISLVDNNLSGTISPELSKLTNLIRLDLMANQLTGPIPLALADLTNLEYLWLPYNQLTGNIPIELGNLTNLNELNLSGNQLSGTIPLELGNLVNLNELALSSNRLTGTIPQALCFLPDLTRIELSFNQLTGSLPPELGNLTNLTWLSLSFNGLTGPVPPELGYLANLSVLSLWHNQLSGPLPPELGNLTNLTSLQLSFNELTGSIPSELGNLTNLSILSLSSNELTGSIPAGLGNLVNLSSLSLNSNQLTGPIPAELGNLVNLNILGLSYNQLTGPIPSELGNLVNLVELELYNNQLTDNIPSELGYLENLEALRLFDNQLAGPIPIELGNLINLTELKLNDNQLTGLIPAELENLIDLIELKLNDNQLTGDIPVWLGNLEGLIELDLSDNQLTGPIPSELGNLVNLITLCLHNNRLTGTVPPEVENLSSLEVLTVGANRLTNPPNGTVALIIDSGVSTQIEPELQQFKTDLEDEGYAVVENVVADITPPEIRSYLQELYVQTNEDLEGAILIGDIPYAYQWYTEIPSATVPDREVISYQYYNDLDGIFETSSGYISPGGREYSYDLHSGDRNWEIWVGVLPYYKGSHTETVSALERYFSKNHEYRTCGYSLPEVFLHISEGHSIATMEEHYEVLESKQNGSFAWTPFSSEPSALIYFDSSPGGISVEQGYADLSEGVADFTVATVHGYHLASGQIDISWVENNPVKTAFFFSTGCEVGDLDYTDNFLTSILYSPTSMVVVAQGSTDAAIPFGYNIEGFYGHTIAAALDSGKNYGNSFIAYVNTPDLYPSDNPEDWEHEFAPRVILGDPTLTRLTGCEVNTNGGDNGGDGGGSSSDDSGGGSSGGCFITMAAGEY